MKIVLNQSSVFPSLLGVATAACRSMPAGIDLAYDFLPKILRQAGYTTHHIGKYVSRAECLSCSLMTTQLRWILTLTWTGTTLQTLCRWHQGFYKQAYTPLGRGYDTTYGFLVGGEDHYSQDSSWSVTQCSSVDLSRNGKPCVGTLPPSGTGVVGCIAWVERKGDIM